MRPDPASAIEACAWLEKAAQDLRVAEVDLAASPPLVEDAAFHAQQAAEKALKGFLAAHDRPIRKTHDLVGLGAECVEIDSTLEPLLRRAGELTEFAWRYRYPGSPDPLSRGEIVDALELARQVCDAISAKVAVVGT
ncbi:MAG: HEPN domain-containing protein [Actinobacteria bacterium]|nr:HEPN domain-containing protein [Actinomycetota bacterium]